MKLREEKQLCRHCLSERRHAACRRKNALALQCGTVAREAARCICDSAWGRRAAQGKPVNRACCSAEGRSKHFTQPAGCAFLNEHDVLAHMHSVRCSTVIRVIAMPLLLPPLLLLLPPPPPPPPCCRTNRTTTTDTCIVNFSVIDRMRAHFLSNVIAEFLFHSPGLSPCPTANFLCAQ